MTRLARPFEWVRRQLLTPRGSWLAYVCRVWWIQFAGAVVFALLGTVFQHSLNDQREMNISVQRAISLWWFFAIVVPAIETLLLWGGINIVRRFSRDVILVSTFSAVAWGILHAYNNNLANGFSAAWSFFVMGVALQVAAATSQRLGLLIAFGLHFLTNAFVVVGVVALSFAGGSIIGHGLPVIEVRALYDRQEWRDDSLTLLYWEDADGVDLTNGRVSQPVAGGRSVARVGSCRIAGDRCLAERSRAREVLGVPSSSRAIVIWAQGQRGNQPVAVVQWDDKFHPSKVWLECDFRIRDAERSCRVARVRRAPAVS